MGKKILTFLWVFLISTLLQFALSWLRGGYITPFDLNGLQLSSMAFALSYFVLTIILLNTFSKKLPIWVIIVAISVGACGDMILVNTLSAVPFVSRLASFMDCWIRYVGILAGIVYYMSTTKVVKFATIGFMVIFVLWSTIWGVDLWLEFVKCIQN